MLWYVKSRRAQSSTDCETWVERGVVPTLNAFDTGDTRATVIVFHPHRSDGARIQGDTINTLTSFMGTGGLNTPMITTDVVRRLTPTESELLQGFPKGWTDGQSDSHRYKQMGNAVTVNVTKWIFNSLKSSIEFV